jgi:hypothetical protein
MKTVLDIPEDLANELKRHAQRSGRAAHEDVVHLVRLALLVEGLPITELKRVMTMLPALLHTRDRGVNFASTTSGKVLVSTDPQTGLPVIDSPADAPIRSMTNEQFLSMIEQTQLEEDFDRVGVPL